MGGEVGKATVCLKPPPPPNNETPAATVGYYGATNTVRDDTALSNFSSLTLEVPILKYFVRQLTTFCFKLLLIDKLVNKTVKNLQTFMKVLI